MITLTKMVFALTAIGLLSCSPKIKSNFTNPQSELPSAEPVALLDTDHELPDNILKIGDQRFQDSGF